MGLGKWFGLSRLVFVVAAMVVVVAFTASFSLAVTDSRDVAAINLLFLSLNALTLRGWVPFGGDPCGDQWQGVSCVYANITALKLDGMNLGGTLGDGLGLFNAIIEIDLSNNHIGGHLPSSLPPTVTRLSLAGNQLNGSIPDSLSSLSQLTIMSLNNNLLIGEIPDSFQQLTSVKNMDLSGNNLSGQLPPSMGNLLSLSSLHLQNNKLTGTLDILQDLPLQDLNVENNIFSGPIPAKLLNIPNFRKDGNPFNTIVISPPPVAVPPSLPTSPAPSFLNGPSASETTNTGRSSVFLTTNRVILIVVFGAVAAIALGVCLLSLACCRKNKFKEDANGEDLGTYKSHAEKPNRNSSMHPSDQKQKVSKVSFTQLQENRQQEKSEKAKVEPGTQVKTMAAYSSHKTDHKIDMTGIDMKRVSVQAPVGHSQTLTVDKATANSILPREVHTSTKCLKSSGTLKLFTIATLQQYTESFSEENFVGEGTFGRVYGAELPDGKLLAVKKLITAWEPTNEEFVQLVSSISKVRHANIVDLVGYCNEHGQQLLVYEYYKNGSLHDALHLDGNIHKKLTWNIRIQLALGAAKGLQYLHEACQPPIVHRNFRSTNILLDDKLGPRVSDFGFPPAESLGAAAVLSGHLLSVYGYSAPECESGSYTCKSDVYSFGVVILELLTGRKAYDRSRPRVEQYLVTWAVPQLYDIDALCCMVDPFLAGEFPVKSLSRLADTISRCVQWDPEFRPPMSEIVQDLLHMM